MEAFSRLLAEQDEPASAPAPEPASGSDIVEVYSFNTGLLVLLMVLWSSLGHQVARRTKFMGEGSVACAMGLITGLGILITQRYFSEEVLHQLLVFRPADFFTYLLPPIIFYAGLSVKKKQFFRNFASIASFGILGTYVAFAVIAFVLYGFSKLPNILTLGDCLALGVIFAATDSVAVLQVLKQDKAPLLYSLVFGEGVINDATSVALLRAVQALDAEETLRAAIVADIFLKFLYLFAASLALGLAFGLGTSWLMKSFTFSTPQEVALVGMLGYLSYLTGELMGLSGIVTLFCCAVAISHYALHNVSSMSRVTIVSAFQTLSYVSEGAIFIYVGMDMLDPVKWTNTKPMELTWLFCVLLLLMVAGRAAFVFPLSFAHNWWARERLSLKEMIVIWWAGLIRGAVSVALVYYYFDPAGRTEDSHRSTLIATTLLEVMASVFVFGAATKPLLEAMLPQAAGVEREASVSMELMGGRRKSRGGGRRDDDGGQLYTVVSMEPDDEVANHVDLPGQRPPHAAGGSHPSGGSSDSRGGSSDGSEGTRDGGGRLYGSHGQDLLDLADNMPPAMAVTEQGGWRRGSSSGRSITGRPSQKWNGLELGRESPAAVEHGEGAPAPLHSRRSSGDSRQRSQSLPGTRWAAAERDAVGLQLDGPQPAPSPFQLPFSAFPPGARDPRPDGEFAQRAESTSRINSWWTHFDTRYMQPVFGGAPSESVAAVELHRRQSRPT